MLYIIIEAVVLFLYLPLLVVHRLVIFLLSPIVLVLDSGPLSRKLSLDQHYFLCCLRVQVRFLVFLQHFLQFFPLRLRLFQQYIGLCLVSTAQR